MLISDLHSCDFGQRQKVLVDKIKEHHPDALLYAGDIADDHLPHDNTVILLEELYQDYPGFYVSGNHEFWSGEVEQIKDYFQSFEVKVLEGDSALLKVNEQKIIICGIDDPEIGESEFLKQLEQSSAQSDIELLSVLLAHRPERINQYLEYDFDLILSGHAHGGQWRIPGIINGLYAPNQGFFPPYAGGIYQHGETWHIVSRGLAKESTRIPRIFNRPELVIIRLVPYESGKNYPVIGLPWD